MWKRILHATPRKRYRYRNVKAKPKSVLAMIYRLGAHARADWSALRHFHDSLEDSAPLPLTDAVKIQQE